MLVGKFSISAMLKALTRGKCKRANATVPEPYHDVSEASDDELLQEPERSPELRHLAHRD